MKFIRTILTGFLAFSAMIIPPSTIKATSELAAASIPASVQQAAEDLKHFGDLQQKTGVQNADISVAMKTALVLADLLLDADGQLNLSLCPVLKSVFIASPPEDYEVNTMHILDQLDSSWQRFFNGVTKSADPNINSNLILQALFGLNSPQLITDRHAKMAILAALFAPCNQGPTGDCFAVCELIRDHQAYYKFLAKDFASIIRNGYLTRPVNGQNDNFFFLPILADYETSKKLIIDSSGKIPGTELTLLEVPGFAAAWNVMGGFQDVDISRHAAQLLFQGSTASSIQVTVIQVIEAFAEILASSGSGLKKEILAAKGNYGFSSVTNNPLLRATESAFAGMAEDRPHDSVRANINYCVTQALASVWISLGNIAQSNAFKIAFLNAFNSSFRLVYNLSIPMARVAGDGNSTAGGFQLYERIPGNPAMIGSRIATPEDFRKLAADAILTAAASLGNSGEYQKIACHLNDYIQTNAFLRDALWAYDRANQKISDPVGSYLKLLRTPMQSCDGDNPYEVDDIQTGCISETGIWQYIPRNAKDLLVWCLNMAKRAGPSQILPMMAPGHAFNFDPTNSDLVFFIKSNLNSDQWIREILSVPGMKAATTKMDSATQTAFSNRIWEFISNAVQNKASYQQLVSNLGRKALSIQEYAQGMFTGINQLLRADAHMANEVGVILDTVLLEVLPPNLKAVVLQTAIRFARTNWNTESENIYFCGFFNLRTGNIGFGHINEKKQTLQPMDEVHWVNNGIWQIDFSPGIPSEIAAGF